jgi:hypothetical protein
MKVRETLAKTRDDLPKEAFAIVGDADDPETWKLPHHKKSILRALKGRLDIEAAVAAGRGRSGADTPGGPAPGRPLP